MTEESNFRPTTPESLIFLFHWQYLLFSVMGMGFLFLSMQSKEFYLFYFVVLKMFSLHGIWILTSDALFTFFFFNLVSLIISVKDHILLCLAVFPGVLQYFCVFQVFIESLCFSAFFSFIYFFYFLRCTHTVTLHGNASSQVSMFFLWRGREKSPLPRISTFWPREMCPEELYADGRQLVCLFCCYRALS